MNETDRRQGPLPERPPSPALDPPGIGYDPSSGNCMLGTSRRAFIQLIGVGAAARVAAPWPVMAGPFESSEFEALVPADKTLDPEWVRSLTARGTPTVGRRDAHRRCMTILSLKVRPMRNW